MDGGLKDFGPKPIRVAGPELSTGKKLILGATVLGLLTSCGLSAEVAALATERSTRFINQPTPEMAALATATIESELPTATAESNDGLIALTARAFGVSQAEIEDDQAFPNFGVLVTRDGQPIVWLYNKTAALKGGDVPGLVPELLRGDKGIAGARAKVGEVADDLANAYDLKILKLTGSSEGVGNDKVIKIKAEGGLFDQEATFVYVYHADADLNGDWMVELSDGSMVKAADITSVMNDLNITFSEAVKHYQSQQANN